MLSRSRDQETRREAKAIERLLTITEQLECDLELEPETGHLLAALKTPRTDFDKLMATHFSERPPL